MLYSFDALNKNSLTRLYCDFGVRLKEIGAILGVSEDAVFKRLKRYGLPTNPHNKPRLDVDVLFTGKKKDRKRALTDAELLRLCRIGYTDVAIGDMFNMTGEGIAYRRKQLGITLSIKNNETRNAIKCFKNTSKEILELDYYSLTQNAFSEKYGISKVVWRPYLKELGIKPKEAHRIESYPPFTIEQRSLIIGGLLGDGSVSQGSRYYESHSNKQRLYLQRKYKIMEPYSSEMHPCDEDTGMRFSTVHHPNFGEFYREFYEEGVEGKLIPVDFIKKNWSDEILAYWFFDDGYYDDENNTITIANKCPYPEQTLEMTDFLESLYHFGFVCKITQNMYLISFSKTYYKEFVTILLKVITPDLYYKIPEEFLTKDMVNLLNINTFKDIRPKFYRKVESPAERFRIETVFFRELEGKNFPFNDISEERKIYLLKSFAQHAGYELDMPFIRGTTSGMDLCETFFPNIYECHKKNILSPVDLWRDKDFLWRLVRNRLSHADRLTNSSIRTGIKLLSRAVTNFKPTIAKYLCQKYAPNGRVFDYSCGFGSRMLAAMSLGMEYVGCEPNLKTYENLQIFGSFLKMHTKGSFLINSVGSEEYFPRQGYFDFAFSSPPFFDYEIYSNDPGQSIVKYPRYEDWLINFWRRVIENSKESLIPGGHFGVCISINQHEHMIGATRSFCANLGLVLVDEYRAPYKQLFQKNMDKYDLIMIFKK